MTPLVYALPSSDGAARALASALGAELGALEVRQFPDGESYVRLLTPPHGRSVVVVASMHHPDTKVIPLILTLETARELGATSTGLVAPYLCYMRQDRRFHEGEAVSARLFPRVLGRSLDWLVTVDPHLHRIATLDEVYDIPTRVVHAAPAVAAWIAANVERPLLIGPDSESEQWVSDVARRADAPFVVLEKVRHGDRDVEVSVPEVDRWKGHTPVLVDDIISTGRTMVETLHHLARAGLPPAVCIGVHGLFADAAMDELAAAGARQVVTCDTIPHATNRIGLAGALSEAVRALIPQEGR